MFRIAQSIAVGNHSEFGTRWSSRPARHRYSLGEVARI